MQAHTFAISSGKPPKEPKRLISKRIWGTVWRALDDGRIRHANLKEGGFSLARKVTKAMALESRDVPARLKESHFSEKVTIFRASMALFCPYVGKRKIISAADAYFRRKNLDMENDLRLGCGNLH